MIQAALIERGLKIGGADTQAICSVADAGPHATPDACRGVRPGADLMGKRESNEGARGSG
jgi:hypothetical protein